jgi:hypothetical protein
MRHLHPSFQKLINETAIAYAIADVDSYIHIDNFMAINRSKFKQNARLLFAERTLLREAAANPPRQGVQRTWGQAFSDFASGGFAGLAKGKANLERNYTLAIQNLEQMLNLLDEHPESTSSEVIQTINKSVNNIIKELQGKQQLIKKTSDQMKGVAMDKHRGEAPRGYAINTLDDIANSPLDKVNIYNILMQSPEVLYTVSKTQVLDVRADAAKFYKMGIDVDAIRTFATDYANKNYKPSAQQYVTANIDPKIIYNYLAASNRWKDAEKMAYAKNPALNPVVTEDQLLNLANDWGGTFTIPEPINLFKQIVDPYMANPAQFSVELPGMFKFLSQAASDGKLLPVKARYQRYKTP